MKTKPHNSVCY